MAYPSSFSNSSPLPLNASYVNTIDTGTPSYDPPPIHAPSTLQEKHNDMTTCLLSNPHALCTSSREHSERATTGIRILEQERNNQVPSLYARLRSFFLHKSKPVALLTPPASPENHESCRLNTVPSAQDQFTSAPVFFDSWSSDTAKTSPSSYQWMPLTPESVEKRHGRGSDSWPSLVHLLEDCEMEEGEGTVYPLNTDQVNNCNLPEDSTTQTYAQLVVDNQGLGLELAPSDVPTETEAFLPRQTGLVGRGEGVHLMEAESWPERSKTKSVQWGKSRAPPIRWDVLIDDLSSTDAPGYDTHSYHPAPIYYGYDTLPSPEGEEDELYDLQYALELSRRDRRKVMDSNAYSAGEYSKSRESWASLHLGRTMPAQQEYWFRYWIQWHNRLEEKVAFKLEKIRRKEECKRYMLIDPWPLTDRRTARRPRRADEDLHPNLRLMRHRTRSAPGRIRM